MAGPHYLCTAHCTFEPSIYPPGYPPCTSCPLTFMSTSTVISRFVLNRFYGSQTVHDPTEGKDTSRYRTHIRQQRWTVFHSGTVQGLLNHSCPVGTSHAFGLVKTTIVEQRALRNETQVQVLVSTQGWPLQLIGVPVPLLSLEIRWPTPTYVQCSRAPTSGGIPLVQTLWNNVQVSWQRLSK